MKKLFQLFLVLSSLIFAASSAAPPNLKGSLTNLCESAQSMLGVTTAICAIPLLLIAIIGGWLFLSSKDKPMMKNIGIAVAVIATILFILVLSTYFFAPNLIGALTGMPMNGCTVN